MKPKKKLLRRGRSKLACQKSRKDRYCAERTNHHLQSRETNKRSKPGNTPVQEFVNTTKLFNVVGTPIS